MCLRSKGFTVIELIIVLAIVGIIAAIAIPNLKAAYDRQKEVEEKGTLEERWVSACVENTVERDGSMYLNKIQQQCQLIWDMGVDGETPMIVPALEEEVE